MGDAARHARPGPLVCVVEDDAQVRRLLARMLQAEGYRVIAVSDGELGLRVVAEHQPDLVLLDLSMPRLDGFEVCRRLRNDPRTVALPIIVLTAHSSIEDMVAAIDAGADDFISKPFQHLELLARMRSAFRIGDVVRRMEEAQAIVAALATAVEEKDRYLHGHCRRMAHHAARLAAAIGLRGDELDAVAYGALLHDVGKLAMPQDLLERPWPLADQDWDRLKEHPVIGARIVAPLRWGTALAPVIRHHHERWDGDGYPAGLRGDAIPLGARIVALADAHDAILRGRPYRAARTLDETYEELRRGAGAQFDPGLVSIFIEEMERAEAGLPASCDLPPAALLDRLVALSIEEPATIR